jgi:hypothetical protein
VSEALDHALACFAPEGAGVLRRALARVLGASEPRFLGAEPLPRGRVLRLRFEVEGRSRGLVVKRLSPERAHRERAAIERWLPRVGLAAQGPPLLATLAERAGRCTWFVYEDLGDCTLAMRAANPACVRAAVELVAELHARFMGHALLGEARSLGADLGMPFYTASVRDATRALEALARSASLEAEPRALCERLLARLAILRAEEAERRAVLEAWGGPETLLHGDLWTINVLVLATGRGFEARLIDWERAGVGPASYDLSAFLLRFPAQRRAEILACYEQSCEERSPGARRWPSRGEWNALFDGAERARLANSILWRALAALDGHADWPFEELGWLEEAFAALEPVLPAEPTSLDVETAPPERARGRASACGGRPCDT